MIKGIYKKGNYEVLIEKRNGIAKAIVISNRKIIEVVGGEPEKVIETISNIIE